MKKLFKLLLLNISIILLFVLVSISASAADVWNGTSVAPSQAADGYYVIKTAENLSWISDRVKSGYTSISFKLANDIYLNEVTEDDTVIYNNSWKPIGDSNYQFRGNFKGNGYTIYGLCIKEINDYSGLFGYTNFANISDVSLKFANIFGNSNVGGICGYSVSTNFSACSFNGIISANGNNVGGISGYCYDTNNVDKCSVYGTITAKGNRIGGITGCSYSNTLISESYNSSSVYSDGKYVGGISGTNSGSTISSCYNTGSIDGLNRVGGIVGNNVGKIYYSYNVGKVNSAGDYGAVSGFNSMATVKFCYYLDSCCNNGDEFAISKISNDLKRFSFVTNINENGGNFLYDYPKVNEGYPIMSWQLKSDVWKGYATKPSLYIDKETYMISNGEELAWFAQLVNGTLTDGTPQNIYAKAMLTKSIVLNIGEKSNEASNIWMPIGSNGAEFTGTFNGNGFNISGLYVDSGDNSGLFGVIAADANVSNFSISDAYVDGLCSGCLAGVNFGEVSLIKISYSIIKGSSYVGGIIGENQGSVYNSSSLENIISAEQYCGGITGRNSGVINTCYSLSDISAKGYIGGITGNNSGEIKYCFNGGTVSGTQNYVGGISGYATNGSISDSYNTGNIKGYNNVGGITGIYRSGRVVNCYDVGEITGSSNCGAICGSVYSSTVTNCYYDSQRICAKDSYAKELSTSQMTGSTSISNLTGFNRSIWNSGADTKYFIYYPQLSAFSLSGDFDLYDASLTSVKFLKYEFHCRVSINEIDYYFGTLSEAAEFIGDQTATINVFEDMYLSKKTIINGDITIVSDKGDFDLYRDSSYDGNLFEVNGKLTFGNNKHTLTLDGMKHNISSCTSMIYVNNSGEFNLVNGNICNNNANQGGAITNFGTINLTGGKIYSCISKSNGGAIYNCGTLNIDGSEIYDNTSYTNGGAVYMTTSSAEINIYSGELYMNSASNGGALYINNGTVNIYGGKLSNNSSTVGGAIYIKGGTVNISGGIIELNNADKGLAIYNNSKLNLLDNCYIDSSNDVFLPNGKTVTMVGKIDSNSVRVNVTPEKYEKGIRVVDGVYAAMNYKRVAVNDYETQSWHINSSGYILTDEVIEVARVSIFGAHSVYYTSLEEAFIAIGNDDAIITMIDDCTVESTLHVKSNVTILSDGAPRSIIKSENLNGNMFVVESGATLTLGDNVNETADDILFIDGAGIKVDDNIKVLNNANLNIYNGVVIHNSNGRSAIYNEGNTAIYGGKLTDNSVAINNVENGIVNIFDGVLSNNSGYAVVNNNVLIFHNEYAMDKDDVVFNGEDCCITLSDDYSNSEIYICTIAYENYRLNTKCVNAINNESYKNLFAIADDTYYLNDDLRLDADRLSLYSNSELILDRENDLLSEFNIDLNYVSFIKSQMVNSNVEVLDGNGNICDSNDRVGTGFTVALIDKNGYIYDSVDVVIYGDLDGDGYANGNDSVIVEFIYYGLINSKDCKKCMLVASDVNFDGHIDLSDVWTLEDAGIFSIE